MYYDPIEADDLAKAEELCTKYSEMYPGLEFYVVDTEVYDDEDDNVPGELGYQLSE